MIQLKMCTKLFFKNLVSLFRHCVGEIREAQYSTVIVVKSFTIDGKEYLVFPNLASAIFFYTYMTDCKSMCKLMSLAHSVFVYRIFYDIRLSKNANFSNTSLLDPIVKPSIEKIMPDLSPMTERRYHLGIYRTREVIRQ